MTEEPIPARMNLSSITPALFQRPICFYVPNATLHQSIVDKIEVDNMKTLAYTRITTIIGSVDQALCIRSLLLWCLLAAIFHSLKFEQTSPTRSHDNLPTFSISRSIILLGLASANEKSHILHLPHRLITEEWDTVSHYERGASPWRA